METNVKETKEDTSFISNLNNLVLSYNNRLEWDEYFMCIAILTSSKSNCDKLKVGCVFVKDNHILSTGYNRFLTGDHYASIIKNDYDQSTIHAITNTIAYCVKKDAKMVANTKLLSLYFKNV